MAITPKISQIDTWFKMNNSFIFGLSIKSYVPDPPTHPPTHQTPTTTHTYTIYKYI